MKKQVDFKKSKSLAVFEVSYGHLKFDISGFFVESLQKKDR